MHMQIFQNLKEPQIQNIIDPSILDKEQPAYTQLQKLNLRWMWGNLFISQE